MIKLSRGLSLAAAVLFSTISLFSCRTTGELPSAPSQQPSSVLLQNQSWQNLSPGIQFKAVNSDLCLVKIDLTSENLKLYYSPLESGWQNAVSTKKILKKNNLAAAINTVPFHKKSPLSSKLKAAGIVIQNEKTVSEPQNRYCGIRFYEAEKNLLRCQIYDCQTDIPEKNTIYACGGFWTILNDREIYQFKNIKDFRSACGTSEDGSIVYFLYGKNLSYMDCAEIFMKNGAFRAMEFDGGSSSFLYLKGKKLFKPVISVQPAAILGFYF